MELNYSFWLGRRWRQALLLSGTALLMLWLALGPASKPLVRRAEPLPEMLRTELVLQEGRLVRQGSTNAFSGWVIERYACGAMMSRSAVSNGLLEGLSRGWYTNGQIQVVEHFERGLSHGIRTKWYEGGRKLSEINVVQGKLSGIFRRWHETGALAEELEIKDGQPHGISSSYFPSGFQKARVVIRDGKEVEQTFWKDGEQPGQTHLALGAVTR